MPANHILLNYYLFWCLGTLSLGSLWLTDLNALWNEVGRRGKKEREREKGREERRKGKENQLQSN